MLILNSNSGIYGVRDIHISKHHMLILNMKGENQKFSFTLISKHHMLILNLDKSMFL